MEEKDAIELLGKLEKFMKDTTTNIKDLQVRVHNLQIDNENFKKNASKGKIILAR